LLAEEVVKYAEHAKIDAQRNNMLALTDCLPGLTHSSSQDVSLRRKSLDAVRLAEVVRAEPPRSMAELEEQNHATRLAILRLERDIQRLRRSRLR